MDFNLDQRQMILLALVAGVVIGSALAQLGRSREERVLLVPSLELRGLSLDPRELR